MDYTVLERSTLFRGIPSKSLREFLKSLPQHTCCSSGWNYYLIAE